jgi:hypothetical protein
MKKPKAPATSFTSERDGLLQRKNDGASTHFPFSAKASPSVPEPPDPASHAFTKPRFGLNFSRVPVHAGSGAVKLQRAPAGAGRLSVGAPGDRYEQEAEQVAERVLRTPEPAPSARLRTQKNTPQINPPGGASTKHVQRDMMRSPYSPDEGTDSTNQGQGQSKDQDQGTVQTQEQPGQTPQLTREFENQVGALQGGGQPLAGPVRTSMESRFGHDFSRLHIHTDQTAAGLAASINARAFTLGRDVVFGAGQYAPQSEAGQRLIAHELTHSIQQGQAPRLNPSKAEVPASNSGTETGTKPSSIASPPSPVQGISSVPAVARTIQRVQWNPNVDTGKKIKPWGAGADGKILTAKTDAGTPIDIWKPDDGTTYWCHGFTFGGNKAAGGPYSMWGRDVPKVLNDEGWGPQDSCASKLGDILVFTGTDPCTHSGIIRNAVNSSGGVDENASMLDSKWGNGAQNTNSWAINSGYGQYQCYSKNSTFGGCKYRGIHETGTKLPLPPGDYPQQQQKNTAVG